MRLSKQFPLRFLHHGRQDGQALIYGIFMLLVGSAALFFMFNTGQLTSEKTKLVNTADMVAYSAGVMHARALNFDAYTNRAMMANEVMIAQLVSVSSWIQYSQAHMDAVPPLDCYTIYSVPVALVLLEYAPLCYALSYPAGAIAVGYAKEGVDIVAPIAMAASEVAKTGLQAAQAALYVSMLPMRKELMQQVADANYLNDGSVKVDLIPITDNYTMFEGGSFINRRSGNDRTRFKEAELTAARKDNFVADRSWSSHSPWPCIVAPRGDANRSGGTTLEGFDEWRADDSARLSFEHFSFNIFHWGCKSDGSMSLGSGTQSAKKDSSSSSDWSYGGVPSFYELSDKALAYTPENSDKSKRDPIINFAIRLTRANTEANTTAGRSAVKPKGQFNIYQGNEAKNVMSALATSQVYFERTSPRADGKTELASLFNPYWQVRLKSNSNADLAIALALQNP